MTTRIATDRTSRRHSLNHWVLRLLAHAAPSEQNRLLFVTLVAGAACGLVAVSFHFAIDVAEKLATRRVFVAGSTVWVGWGVLLPVVGAIIAGLALTRFPAARGSGIPQVKAVYALSTTKTLRLRDSVAKFILASIQIGSGASLGREGPTVQICATVASALGRAFALSPSNQRRLIPVGAAAGVAAAFNSPIAAVTFVIEELVGAFDTTVLSGVVIAAAIAAVVERSVLGEHAVLSAPASYGLDHPSSLLIFALMGLAAGVSGSFFSTGLLRLRAWFNGSWIPARLRPAVGALISGVLAVSIFVGLGIGGVAGGGYHTVELALAGKLSLELLLALFVAKVVATIFSYSSGGVGGIFAPTLFIGAMLGGAFGYADRWLLGHEASALGSFALVGMGAFFAAVVRAPMTSVLIIFEMTGSYRLILPLMISNMIGYLVSRRIGKTPIYDALLEQDGIRLPHSPSSTPALSTLTVGSAMTKALVVLRPEMTVGESLVRIAQTTYVSLPVRDADGRLLGVVTEARLRRLASEVSPDVRLREHVRVREFLHSGQTLRDALSVMTRLGIRQVAVVSDVDRSTLVGILSMSDVMRIVLAHESSADPRATPLPTVEDSNAAHRNGAEATKPHLDN